MTHLEKYKAELAQNSLFAKYNLGIFDETIEAIEKDVDEIEKKSPKFYAGQLAEERVAILLGNIVDLKQILRGKA